MEMESRNNKSDRDEEGVGEKPRVVVALTPAGSAADSGSDDYEDADFPERGRTHRRKYINHGAAGASSASSSTSTSGPVLPVIRNAEGEELFLLVRSTNRVGEVCHLLRPGEAATDYSEDGSDSEPASDDSEDELELQEQILQIANANVVGRRMEDGGGENLDADAGGGDGDGDGDDEDEEDISQDEEDISDNSSTRSEQEEERPEESDSGESEQESWEDEAARRPAGPVSRELEFVSPQAFFDVGDDLSLSLSDPRNRRNRFTRKLAEVLAQGQLLELLAEEEEAAAKLRVVFFDDRKCNQWPAVLTALCARNGDELKAMRELEQHLEMDLDDGRAEDGDDVALTFWGGDEDDAIRRILAGERGSSPAKLFLVFALWTPVDEFVKLFGYCHISGGGGLATLLNDTCGSFEQASLRIPVTEAVSALRLRFQIDPSQSVRDLLNLPSPLTRIHQLRGSSLYSEGPNVEPLTCEDDVAQWLQLQLKKMHC
eukprot:g18618.t1